MLQFSCRFFSYQLFIFQSWRVFWDVVFKLMSKWIRGGSKICQGWGEAQSKASPNCEPLTEIWDEAPECSRELKAFCFCPFLQRISIACYGERCISYSKSVRLSVCPSVTRWHWVKTTQATIMGSSLEDSPMTLVSSRLTSPQNSKGNIGSDGAEWDRGRKNRQFLANKSPYLRNGAR